MNHTHALSGPSRVSCLLATISLTACALVGCAGNSESATAGTPGQTGTAADATPATPESQFAAAAQSLDGFLADPNASRQLNPGARPIARPATPASAAAPVPSTPRRALASQRPTLTAAPEAPMADGPSAPPADQQRAGPNTQITETPQAMTADAGASPDSSTEPLTPRSSSMEAADTKRSPVAVAPARLATAPAKETPTQRRERLLSELAELNTSGATPAPAKAMGEALRALLWRSSAEGEPDRAGVSASRVFASRAASLRPSLDAPDARVIDATDTLLRQLSVATDRDRVVGAIVEASAAVVPSGTLTLPAVQLCTRVESFGRFLPIASTTLPAGQAFSALLYTEVDGFTNAPAPAGTTETGAPSRFTVELSQELALYSEMGSVIWTARRQSLKEESRNRRRDFFTTQRVDLPASLAPGKYSLKVTLRDEAIGAVAERAIDLTFVAGAGPNK
ncbi:MAG: hypothetical protein K2X32_14980 [Phycisphaerales bacterium]|nr:hypothetical protein [Phycisphaerales bacterium]